MADLAGDLFGPGHAAATTMTGTGAATETGTGRAPAHAGPEVTLVDWDPDAEVKVVTAMLYPYTHLREPGLARRVWSHAGAATPGGHGQRTPASALNRRHRPGRALERCGYRFDVVSDYGAFRDLQRHRLLTIEWQGLTPYHGYTMPAAVAEAGGAPEPTRRP